MWAQKPLGDANRLGLRVAQKLHIIEDCGAFIRAILSAVGFQARDLINKLIMVRRAESDEQHQSFFKADAFKRKGALDALREK